MDEAPEELLDRAVIADLRAGIDLETLLEVIDDYESDSAGRLSAITNAVGAGDARSVADAAHALRGASASIGAARVARLSARLEELARAGDLDGAPALADELACDVRDTPAALRQELSR